MTPTLPNNLILEQRFLISNLCTFLGTPGTHKKISVWLKLKKDKFGEPGDIFIGTFNLSPESYEKQMKSNYMDELEKDLVRFSGKVKY